MFPERWWNLLFGSRGERLAARLLKQKGYRILARNCRSRWGELDLIARDGDTIVFVEVKTRSQSDTGAPRGCHYGTQTPPDDSGGAGVVAS